MWYNLYERLNNTTQEVTFLSIKLYDWILVENTNVFKLMNDIRSVIEPIFLKKMSYNILTAGEAILDAGDKEITWNDTILMSLSSSHGEEKLPTRDRIGQLVDKTIDLTDRLYRDMSVTFSDADIGYEVTILPGPDDNDVVFRVFSESDDYFKAIKDKNIGRDFSYWNNTDKEDGVSDVEWEKRKKYWEGLPQKSFSSIGLSFFNPSRIDTSIALKHVRQELQDMVKNRSNK